MGALHDAILNGTAEERHGADGDPAVDLIPMTLLVDTWADEALTRLVATEGKS